jgi:chemotaxis protein methyltransferase CheR
MIRYSDVDAGERISEEADYLTNQADYIKFLERLYAEEGVDLSLYKQNQLRRRMNMFIKGSGHKGYCEFLDYARKNEQVYRTFIDRITINVSEFFRNPEKFVTLEERFLLPALKRKTSPQIWSAGCSSGEEAYTLALLLEKHRAPSSVKVLGWDFDANILKRAQAGVYDRKALLNVPAPMLQEFFVQQGPETYAVGPRLKARVRFERHTLLEDRFPSGMDVVLCRNVVIYFNERAKEDLFIRFGQCLDPQGVLFIGASERIANAQQARLAAAETFFYQPVQQSGATSQGSAAMGSRTGAGTSGATNRLLLRER